MKSNFYLWTFVRWFKQKSVYMVLALFFAGVIVFSILWTNFHITDKNEKEVVYEKKK